MVSTSRTSLLVRDLANVIRFEAFIDPRCYEVIDDYELPLEFSNRCYKRFRVRPPHIAAKDRDSMHQKLILLSTKIQFNLGTGSHESKNDDSYSDGVTTLATTGWQRTICNLSYQLLEPLLSPTNQKITPAERMLCHFNIAIALLHEFAVGSLHLISSVSDQHSMLCGIICGVQNIPV